MLPVLVFNTTIVTGFPHNDGEAAVYTVARISLEDAQALVANEVIESAVGHEGTAQVLTALLGKEIPVNRQPATQAPGQVALCLKLRERLPEGRILTAAEMAEVGYDLFGLVRHV